MVSTARSRCPLVLSAVVVGVVLSAPGARAIAAQAPAAPVVSNDRVIVHDVTWTPGQPLPADSGLEDTVVVFLRGGSLKETRPDGKSSVARHRANDVAFEPKGSVTMREAIGGPVRAIVISLRDGGVAPLANTSGYPEAFPRPGSRKVLENDRVTVWEYTFMPGKPSPMHFHSRDVVTIYTEDGAVKAVTPAGVTSTNEHHAGEVVYNPRNRTHSEELAHGAVHIIATELR